MRFLRTAAPILPLAYAAVHTVEVGDGGLTFEPRTLTAVEGDTIVFNLYAVHDIVVGDFDDPCRPDDDGWYSGPFDNTDNGALKFVVNVTSDDPIYYYCSVQRHCQMGMVGGVNLPTTGDETIDAYASAASGVAQASTPASIRGGQLLDDAAVASLTGSASPSATASGSSASGSGSATTTPASGSATPTSGSSTASATGAQESAQSTGAADFVAPAQIGGIAAAVLGAAAWFV